MFCHVLASRALNMSGYFDQSARSIESRCVVITLNSGVPVHAWCKSIVPMFANGIWYLSSDYRTSLGISCQIIVAWWYTGVRVSGPTHHWFRYSGNGLSPVRLGHYLKQWWIILNQTFRNKRQRNLNWKKYFRLKKVYVKNLSTKCRRFCSGPDDVLNRKCLLSVSSLHYLAHSI